MLARRALPGRFEDWNRRWGAPFGYRGRTSLEGSAFSCTEAVAAGFFGAEPNSTTRRVEYPWAFHASEPVAGTRVVDVGGGLAGLQFVLDRAGADVVNVDRSWRRPACRHVCSTRSARTRG